VMACQRSNSAIFFPFVLFSDVVLAPLHVSSWLWYGSSNVAGPCSPLFQHIRIWMYVIILSVKSFWCTPSRKQEQTKWHSFKNRMSFPHNLIVSPSSAPTLHNPTHICSHSGFISVIT
jgi:hypothetical protein